MEDLTINKNIEFQISNNSIGFLYIAGSVAFFGYLATGFNVVDRPKYLLDREIVDIAKKTQPGIEAEYYYKK